MERRRIFSILVLLNLAVVIVSSIPYLAAEYDASSYQCMASLSIVCLGPDFPPGRLTLATKYGQLIPLHDMAFRDYVLLANGTMVFDVTGLAPSPDIALQFSLRSFGNGTFYVRIRGPSALGISADKATQTRFSAHESWGDGVEIAYATSAVDLLIINYKGVGPGPCWPACIPVIPRWVQGAIILVPLAITTSAFFLIQRVIERKTRKTEEHKKEDISKT